VGELADTGYTIPKFRGANKTLMDIMQTLLDMTTENTGRLYALYDDFGKLTLKDLEDMKIDLLIDAETAENFVYESSIDKDTYNRIKLYYDNKETGKRDVWMAVNSADITRWGILQLTESVNPKKAMNFGQLADSKLKLHDRVKRTLTIKNAFGDLRVRGGTMLYVNLKLGDVMLTKQIIVETVKHTLTQGHHTMDLTVKGDVITG
jgi:phage late control gene D protein (GPD)